MRIRLLVEGVETDDGRLIEPNAIGWFDDIPIMDQRWEIIGYIADIHRDDDGSITGDVDREYDILTCGVNDLVMAEDKDGVLRVAKGHLAYAMTSGPWPWPSHPQKYDSPPKGAFESSVGL